MDAFILWGSLGALVFFLIALVPAWYQAYWNHPELNKFGMRKTKPEIYEYDPTGKNTYKK